MKVQILAAFLPISFCLATPGAVGRAPMPAVAARDLGPAAVAEANPLPKKATYAYPPSPGSYQLKKSFEITDTPVTRTFDWVIS
jgi:hypothetical protein